MFLLLACDSKPDWTRSMHEYFSRASELACCVFAFAFARCSAVVDGFRSLRRKRIAWTCLNCCSSAIAPDFLIDCFCFHSCEHSWRLVSCKTHCPRIRYSQQQHNPFSLRLSATRRSGKTFHIKNFCATDRDLPNCPNVLSRAEYLQSQKNARQARSLKISHCLAKKVCRASVELLIMKNGVLFLLRLRVVLCFTCRNKSRVETYKSRAHFPARCS